MPFTTYNELKSSIATWLARDDLTDNIPDFIRLFEAAACRRLRVREMETTDSLTPTNGSATLPADFLAVRRLTWTGSPRGELAYVHPAYLEALYPNEPSGIPGNYTIEGETIKVRPVNDTDIELVYLARNTAAETTLSWLFSDYPDIYLYGSLAEAHGFMMDTEQLALWKARRDEGFEEIKQNNFNYRGPMSVRVAGPTP